MVYKGLIRAVDDGAVRVFWDLFDDRPVWCRQDHAGVQVHDHGRGPSALGFKYESISFTDEVSLDRGRLLVLIRHARWGAARG